MKDSTGHELSGGNARALESLERGMHEFHCLMLDPVASVDAALAEAPDLVMAHVLRGWLYALSTEAAALPVVREALAAATALPHDEREARHLQALAQVADRHWVAAGRTLEDLSIDHPRDLLALQAGHQIDFFTGDARMLRDRLARALPAWSDGMPGHHAVLGMYAFGLEECGDYANAERLGRRAVELEPRDAWAQHAVAHVHEMQGRREEGIRWMRGNAGWQQGSLLGVHNWWHLALYHLAQDDVGSVLALVDGPIDGARSALHLDLLDVSSMLWRLQLRGVDVGGRWQSVAERWAPSAAAGSGHYAFNDMHAAMAFASAGRDDLVRQVLAAQDEALRRDDDNAMFTREVGGPATQAMAAFADGDYRRAADLLRGVRSRAHRFGGSHAQRDVIDLTLIATARRGGQASLAAALEAERAALAGQRGVKQPVEPSPSG